VICTSDEQIKYRILQIKKIEISVISVGIV